MPSLQLPWRARRPARRLTVLLLSLTSASCDSLYGGFSADNLDNCVRNAALCSTPDQTCNMSTKLCESVMVFTTVSPAAGTNVGGTLVTISGDHFVPGMTVNFDGVPATAVTMNSAQALTAVAPARPGRQGLVAIELVQPAGQRLQKDRLFRYYGEVTFQTQCFTGPRSPTLLVATSLNGDNKSDLLIGGYDGIRSYVSSGDGLTFPTTFDINLGQRAWSIAAADLNGDGKIDITVPTPMTTNTLATALGNGDGTFQGLVTTTTTKPVYALAVADVTGDQRPDVVSMQDKELVVQAGNKDGTFQAEQRTPYNIQRSTLGVSLKLIDVDGDGLLDALPTVVVEPSINLLFGTGTGWAPLLKLPLVGNPFFVMVGDYDQDGVLDLAVSVPPKVQFAPGLGGRKFGAYTELVLPNNSRVIEQGDFNGDGILDLFTLNPGTQTGNLQIYLGTGAASFVAQAPIDVTISSTTGTVGDWDGDGKPDLVTLSQSGDSICVLHNLNK